MDTESRRLFSADLAALVPESVAEEVRSLRLALHDSRERQRREALESVRRILAGEGTVQAHGQAMHVCPE